MAQKPASGFSAEVLLGPSIPVGKFADKSVNTLGASEASGWAKMGPALQVAFNYHIKPAYGITLLFGGQENKQDASALNEMVKQYYPNGDRYTVSTKSWKSWKMLAGGFFRAPLSDAGKWYFQGKLLAGMLKTSVPAYSYSAYTTINGSIMPLGSGSHSGPTLPWSFCYQLDAGLGWQFSKKLSLLLDVSYFHAEPIWKYTLYVIIPPPITVPPPNGGGTPTQTKVPVSGLNIMAGMGFRF